MFDEFLQVLGDKVRLRGFDKYKGGLDTVHDLTGKLTGMVEADWSQSRLSAYFYQPIYFAVALHRFFIIEPFLAAWYK